MLNEKRVKHMVKLASYENNKGAEEIKIYTFFRKDYVSYNVLITSIWITLGYFSFVGLLCLAFIERILENLTYANSVTLIAAFAVGYLLTLIVYGVGAARFYKMKHQRARNRVKRYIKNLEILEKMYEREEA